jgi:branched-chain amino acid aminotransferase
LGYQPNILGRYWAKDQGYNDIIILNEHNEVMSTSVGNIFLFIQEKWKTPPLSSGCLNGIMRRQILAHFPQIVEEYPITMMQLQKAQSGFFTNSLIGIQPFSAIEHRLLKDHAFIQEASDRINHYN